jgi:DNA-binding NarL/FixJ family response regulator
MPQSGKRILMVDDYDSVHTYYGTMLQRHGMETARAYSGEDAVRLVAEGHVDLVIMDISMPKAKLDGIAACREIHERFHVPVLIFTAAREFPQQDWRPLAQAALAKAVGFVDKAASDSVFLRTVQRALNGERAFDPEQVKVALAQWDQLCHMRKLYSRLTRREKQVLELLRKGLTNQEMAELLRLSVETVNQHVGSILAKLEVANRVQAAVLGTSGWIEKLT